MYLSAKFAHFGWHVGLTKSGKAKSGKRTAYGQKAIQFARKPIVPVTPHFDKGIIDQDQTLAFIDEEEEDLLKGPQKIRRIKDLLSQ